MSATDLDGADDGTVGHSTGSVNQGWRIGDPVRIRSQVRLLHGAVGRIVEVDVPGPSPYRVRVSGRRGLGRVLVRAEEVSDGVMVACRGELHGDCHVRASECYCRCHLTFEGDGR